MFIEAKDDGGGGDNWTTGAIHCRSCKVPVKSSRESRDKQTNIQFFLQHVGLLVVMI